MGLDYKVKSMEQNMKNILIVTKATTHEARELAEEISRWLGERNIDSRVQENSTDSRSCPLDADTPDMVLVLGGDGTMLSVIRKLEDKSIPLLGLNYGQVGFLTELNRENWQQGLSEVMEGNFLLSSRSLLSVVVVRNSKEAFSGLAVNDVVLCRGNLARLISLRVWYGDEEIAHLRADGIIVSTSTGSTAYAVSAGGPLVYPDLEVISLTPICPFLSGFSPMILPFGRDVRIRVQQGMAQPCLTMDGQTGFDLLPGDEILVTPSPAQFSLVQPGTSSYFQKLKSKGFIKET